MGPHLCPKVPNQRRSGDLRQGWGRQNSNFELPRLLTTGVEGPGVGRCAAARERCRWLQWWFGGLSGESTAQFDIESTEGAQMDRGRQTSPVSNAAVMSGAFGHSTRTFQARIDTTAGRCAIHLSDAVNGDNSGYSTEERVRGRRGTGCYVVVDLQKSART